MSLLAIKDNSSDILVIMPIFSIMMFVSTFSYDEFNKFNTYVSTLPNGRKEAVKAKYISTFKMSPKYTKNIAKIALKKKPDKNIFILKFLSVLAAKAPNTESKQANIATATY